MINSNSVGSAKVSGKVVVAFPNPFSQATTISFSSAEGGIAEVSVVNTLGTQVSRIYSGELSAGEDKFSWDASGMASGMYECIVRMNSNIERIAIALIHN